MFHLSLNPVFDSYLLVAVAAAALIGLLFVGPDRAKTTRWQRAVFVLIRAVVASLIVLAMLRPTLVYTQTKKQAATLVVLADQSRSMSVPDAAGRKTRWEALRAALAASADSLGRLQREFELKAYTFDGELHETSTVDGLVQLPKQPTGRETAIGAALDDAMRQEAGKRLLGVLLLSDGAQRTYAPRDLPPQTAAARLRHLGYPMYTCTLGQSRGLGEAKDVALKDLLIAPTVFVNNELTIRGQVRVDGYVNIPIPVRVLFETSPGRMETVAQQTVRAQTDGQLLPIELHYVPKTPGEWRVTLEAPEQPGELVTTNNRLSTFVQVLKGGLNVLYIEGALRVESKFIRRALDSSPDIKVDYVRLDARDPTGRPADLAERLRSGKYLVYLLGDVDSAAFQKGELDGLAESVARGAGLMMLGGFQSFGAGGYGDSPLARVLPVGMDRFERQRSDEPVRDDLHWPGPLRMQPTATGFSHFLTTLSARRSDNATLWSELPPLDGANRFHDVSPGATVLADSGPDHPLLVAQNYGDGRVLAFAGDSTWRWWLQGHEAVFKRFWRQAVLWLARKDQMREGGAWIRLARRRFAPSEQVDFTVGVNSSAGEPIAEAELKADVVAPDGVRRSVALLRQGERATGTLRDLQTPGDYTIELTAGRAGQSLGAAKARFLVFPQDLELDNAAADGSTMESLAAMTGGRAVPPEQLPQLVRQLTEETKQFDIPQETKKTFWDTWPFFLAVVTLLGVEWFCRKRWGLV
ncbi:MAG: glutamine amidotransferase [Thermoguttaceae bacterium]